MAISTIQLTINSGAQHSDIQLLRGIRGQVFTLVANALTSCQLYLQLGTSTNSANLKRMDQMPTLPSSTWVWSVGVGDKSIVLPLFGTAFIRVETSVAQSDNRSLALVVGGL